MQKRQSIFKGHRAYYAGAAQAVQRLSIAMTQTVQLFRMLTRPGFAGMVRVMNGPCSGAFNVSNHTEFTMLELAQAADEVVYLKAQIAATGDVCLCRYGTCHGRAILWAIQCGQPHRVHDAGVGPGGEAGGEP